ncbi:MAG TPA: porin family protein [Bacteroidales bacterium]|nr:porin family protein [Bacteroidales bacterium]
MKKVIFIICITIQALNCLSQDTIYKKDGSDIKAKIIEIEENNIKYRSFDQLDGPIRNIYKSEISRIVYIDGTIEEFETEPPNQALQTTNQRFDTLPQNRTMYPSVIIKGGLNISDLRMISYGLNLGGFTRSIAGFNIGSNFEFPVELLKKDILLSIQVGLNFNSKGTKAEDKIVLYYLDIPVLLKAEYEINDYKIFALLGPYIGFGLTGKYKWDGETDDILWGSTEDDDFERPDMGLIFGLGGEMRKIQVLFNYNLGLINTLPFDQRKAEEDDWFEGNSSSKNRVFSISVGYRIELNK